VIDYYSKPENLERLKGPILEEKAVDHILSQINKNEIKVTSQEFFEKYAPHLNVPTNGM
jgi:trigger factor